MFRMAPNRMAQTHDSNSHSRRLLKLPSDSAIGHVQAHLRLWIVTGVFLGADLWTKAWAVRTLPVESPDPPTYLFGLFSFRRSFNTGALFGLGEGLSSVFIAASVLALVFVLYIFACSSRRQWTMHVALGLILAGALGNLYDRATCTAHLVTFKTSSPSGPFVGTMEIVGDPHADPVLLRNWGTDEEPVPTPRQQIASIKAQGVVRDFIKFEPQVLGYEVWRWVFNVADVALTVGVAILLIHFWADRKRPASAGRSVPGPPQDAPV